MFNNCNPWILGLTFIVLVVLVALSYPLVSYQSANEAGSQQSPIREDSLAQIRTELEAAARKADDAVLADLAERCAGIVEATDNKSDAANAIRLIEDISKLSPSINVARHLAAAVESSANQFEAEEIEKWQPVFSFLWYNMRRPSDDGTNQEHLREIARRKDFLSALHQGAESEILQAIALYVKIENRLVVERELGVLSSKERDEAIGDARKLLNDFGSLKKPDKKRSSWEEPFQHYATGQLVELENLHIGAVPPDIEGDDLDGVAFKLSDYRGKVVIISFWGAWCGPCLASVPAQRELVDRLDGKPFAIVGVNTDSELEAANAAVEKHQIGWRSFWNGPGGWEGNIAENWFVQGYPLYYVLDRDGRIQFKSRSYDGVEKIVDKLLADQD